VTEFSDGSLVSYLGTPHEGIQVGDQGQVLIRAGRGAHVKWASGNVTLVDAADLQPVIHQASMRHDGLEDSLEVGVPNMSTGLAHLCAVRGPSAVLATIASAAPAEFASIADEIRVFASRKIQHALAMREVVAQLDDDEATEVLRLATIAIIQGIADG
jgi:hypothetical protein